jgi:hypothetical protein
MYSNHNASAQALVDRDPSNVLWQRELIESLEWRALLCEKVGVAEPAISGYWKQAYAIAQRLNAINPANEEWAGTLRRVRLGFARDQTANGDRQGAEVLWDSALAQAWKELLRSPEQQSYHETLTDTIKGKSSFLWEHSTPAARVAFHEQCLDQIVPWEAAARTNAWWLWTIAGGYGQLSGALNYQGRKVEALQNLRRALAYREQLSAAFPDDGKVVEFLADNYHWALKYALEAKDWGAGEEISRASWEWTSTNRIAPLQLPYVRGEVGTLVAELAVGLPPEETERAARTRRLAERCFGEWFASAPVLNEEEKVADRKLRKLLGLPAPKVQEPVAP